MDKNGPCSANYSAAEAKRVMVENTKETTLVCGSSKFVTDCAVQFCTQSDLKYVITDAGVTKEHIRALSDYTNVLVAK